MNYLNNELTNSEEIKKYEKVAKLKGLYSYSITVIYISTNIDFISIAKNIKNLQIGQRLIRRRSVKKTNDRYKQYIIIIL